MPQPSTSVTTGQLSLAAGTTLDHETKRKYSLSVITTERDGTVKLAASRTVLLTITDVNEAPVFETLATYALNVAENSTGNIGDPVTATDPEGQALTYSLSGTDEAAFTISGTGQLSLATSTSLDHETKRSYSFSVTATERDGTVKLTASRAVLLTITDVNEAPVFETSATYALSVAENSTGEIGDPVTANDLEGQALTYSLSGTDEAAFTISGTGQLSVATSTSLDHETKRSYSFSVIATERDGAVKLTVSRAVLLTVIDVNEAPEFETSGAYALSVAENSIGNIGNPVTATDPENRPLDYSLYGTDATTFTVNDTGQLSLATDTTLDHETKRSYSFSVIATERDGADKLTASRAVLLTVTDVNEAPEFETSGTYALNVEENSSGEIGDPVTATDPEGQALTYSLSGTDEAAFTISGTGQLSVATSTSLDHETKRSYSFSVIATERDGAVKLTASRAVLLTVTDVNEAPEFETSGTYALSVAENSTGNIGDPVTANDPENRLLDYSLSGTDEAAFNISDKGQLSLASSTMLDYETKRSYSFSVIATEQEGTDRFAIIRAVSLTVTAVDEPPVFTPSTTYDLEVAENSTGNIGNPVTATDPEGENLIYSLSGTDEAAFDISDKGQLSLATGAILDYETKRRYSFSVIATEEGANGLTATRAVSLTVTDGNDAPVFTSSTTYELELEENSTGEIGDPVTATDLNGDALIYNLSGTDAAAFTVNGTGQLSLATGTTLDYETKRSYSFSVIATERDGADRFAASRAVSLTITDINEAPEFETSTTYALNVAENSSGNIGDPVTATDPENDLFAYNLSGTDAAAFDISAMGQLSLAAGTTLDHEAKRNYSFSVIATEQEGTDRLTSSRAVSLTVTDVNEAPEFEISTTYELDVAENSTGEIGEAVTATDPDGESLIYSLSGTNATAFTISGTGQLSVATDTTLDYETKRNYTFFVVAEDERGLTVSRAVSLTVTGVDEAPVFTPSTTYDLRVPENSSGEIGEAVTATDPEGKDIIYTLSGTDEAAFDIDAMGQLSLATDTVLDFEARTSYTFSVIATEQGTDGLASTRDVLLTVTDVDEVPRDWAILKALYNATDGPNWTVNDGWVEGFAAQAPTAEELNGWHGVTITGNQVTGLNLASNNLVGTLPTTIGNLTALTVLKLSDNNLNGNIPTQLGNLTNLTELTLSDNQLTGKIPTQLGNLVKLETLSLDRNQLTDKIPAQLGNLVKLKTLNLYHNQLTGIIPTELGDLAKLEHLILYANNLSGTIPTELGNLTTLEHLILYANQLSGIYPDRTGQPDQHWSSLDPVQPTSCRALFRPNWAT